MRIALNGGTGYIGPALIRHLAQRRHNVASFINEVNDTPYMPLDCGAFDAFIHLAGVVGDEAFDADPDEAVRVNMDGLVNVLKACAGHVKRFVYVSSGAVYGTQTDKTTADLTEEARCLPQTHYAQCKMACEEMVKAGCKVGDMEYVITRPGSVCGVSPNMNWKSVVNKMTHDALDKSIITVNDGSQYRAVTSMWYLCNALEIVCQSDNPIPANQVYNVSEASKPVWYLAGLVQMVVADTGKRPEIVTNLDDKDDRSYRMDSSKMWYLSSKANVYPTILISSIREMCDWWKEHNG